MKKNLITSMSGITDGVYGERYSTIFSYFVPEYITALLFYSVPIWLDAAFIGALHSTSVYTTLGVTNNLIHFIVKIAEAFSVGTVVLSGQFNGVGSFKLAGRAARDAFWVNTILGFSIGGLLYMGASYIYTWHGVAPDVIQLGVPFLRLRAISIFFMFIYLAIIGFLRGIKNTKTPMQIFIIGTLAFIFFDYVLIFGHYGFPALGLQGSAYASIIQYAVMMVLSIAYIMRNHEVRKYSVDLFAPITDGAYVKRLIMLSWPMVLDKAILAAAYIWLCKMLTPMGTCAVATFCIIKDMERFAFLPALACAQIITFLVSNDIAAQRWLDIKANIKKIIFLSSVLVGIMLLVLSLYPESVITLFDKKGEFTTLAARVFPLLSILVFFDLLQLLLSGALRGAGDVKTVMMVRLVVCLGYFMPLSYLLAHMPMQDQTLKFVLVYGSFYVGNALMSIVYINRFRGHEWKTQS